MGTKCVKWSSRSRSSSLLGHLFFMRYSHQHIMWGCKFYFTTSLMISYLVSGKLYDKYVLLTILNHLYANLHSALIKELMAVRES